MNGISYLADTNAFIYLLNGSPLLEELASDGWSFSYITEIELLSKNNITTTQELIVQNMLDTCLRVYHSQNITERAIKIKRKYKLKLPDAIIAASALSIGLPLITADKEFKKIEELDLIFIEP